MLTIPEKIDIKSLDLNEIEMIIKDLGQPKYRAKQIFGWIQQKKIQNFAQMTNLPKSFIDDLSQTYYIPQLNIKKRLVSTQDNTIKYLYELEDHNTVESVLMEYNHGTSICISTQVGCKMGCTFCASTIGGCVRNLTPSEMLLEIEKAEQDSGRKISNVVLMGIGEPLDNFENVVKFLQLLSHPDGHKMSLRNVTVSTCGLVDKINELSDYNFGLTLAVSLHAPTNEVRSKTMPVNKRYPIEKLLLACVNYSKKTGRRITYEYALIDGENDSAENANQLAKRLKGTLCHVNLIPVNEVAETGYKQSSRKTADLFIKTLEKYGVTATLRRTLGSDIDAACGQLRRENL